MAKRNIAAIIPARGGSKGIPRKNVRFLAGRPLIAYAIDNALRSRHIDTVIVSTDDEEIAGIAEASGARALRRPPELAADDVPLDPVIHHAVATLEQETGAAFDLVVTLQPTSPLLMAETIDTAIDRLVAGGKDTLISVVDDRHLSWTVRDGRYIPAYTERKNRQYLPPNFRETGGIVVTRREFVTPASRFGPAIDLLPVPREQAVDIDHQMDWWIAEKLLRRRRLLIRAAGYQDIGLGHVYRTLLLAGRLIDHEILFAVDGDHDLALEMIEGSFYPYRSFSGEAAFEALVDDYRPDIVINDILDTEVDYVQRLRDRGVFVVNFEDMGDGAAQADIVINALYEKKLPLDNYHWGQRYYCLREEFFLVDKKDIAPTVGEILLTFGGTDANDYSARVLALIGGMGLRDLRVTVIAGRGYQKRDQLEALARSLDLEVEILQDVKTISQYMRRADIIFTSAGRTVYEIASIGTPVIVLAQNNRELLHTFARSSNGIINLGLGTEVKDEEITKTLRRLIDDVDLRRKCNRLMLENDLRSGIDNVLETLFSQYEAVRAGSSK